MIGNWKSEIGNWKSEIGSVLLMTIFVIALLAALVMGILQMNTEEIQLMQNQVYGASALAIAEAGLNDAWASLRADSSWDAGITSKPFNGGSYSVRINGSLPNLTVESTGTSSQGFVARVQAKITVDSSSPAIIRIDNLRINE